MRFLRAPKPASTALDLGATPIATGGTGYTRFVVAGGGRTGSTMLVQALNSHSQVRCFGELFNLQMAMGGIGFDMPGYDNFSNGDRALRDRDPAAFLRRRIFCPHPPDVRAVGFKLLYAHFLAFPGLVERLAQERDLRVIHIRRRNLLRMFLSTRIALRTGVWVERRRLTWANLYVALRHPLRAAGRLRRPLRRPEAAQVRAAISPEACLRFFQRAEDEAARVDALFRDRELLQVSYEELTGDRERAFADVQTFLGVEPRALQVATRRQNPEPLRELIANYDELHQTFQGTPYATFFD